MSLRNDESFTARGCVALNISWRIVTNRWFPASVRFRIAIYTCIVLGGFWRIVTPRWSCTADIIWFRICICNCTSIAPKTSRRIVTARRSCSANRICLCICTRNRACISLKTSRGVISTECSPAVIPSTFSIRIRVGSRIDWGVLRGIIAGRWCIAIRDGIGIRIRVGVRVRVYTSVCIKVRISICTGARNGVRARITAVIRVRNRLKTGTTVFLIFCWNVDIASGVRIIIWRTDVTYVQRKFSTFYAIEENAWRDVTENGDLLLVYSDIRKFSDYETFTRWCSISTLKNVFRI